jgi:hypothetical protein
MALHGNILFDDGRVIVLIFGVLEDVTPSKKNIFLFYFNFKFFESIFLIIFLYSFLL